MANRTQYYRNGNYSSTSTVCKLQQWIQSWQNHKGSEKGYVFKTYEGQLNTGGFSEGDGDMTSSIWNFSVRRGDDEILDQLKNANKEMVRLYYDEKFIRIPVLGDTKYFITKVETVD